MASPLGAAIRLFLSHVLSLRVVIAAYLTSSYPGLHLPDHPAKTIMPAALPTDMRSNRMSQRHTKQYDDNDV